MSPWSQQPERGFPAIADPPLDGGDNLCRRSPLWIDSPWTGLRSLDESLDTAEPYAAVNVFLFEHGLVTSDRHA